MVHVDWNQPVEEDERYTDNIWRVLTVSLPASGGGTFNSLVLVLYHFDFAFFQGWSAKSRVWREPELEQLQAVPTIVVLESEGTEG